MTPHECRAVTHHQSRSITEATKKLITDDQRGTMLANSKLYESDPDFNPVPVVKIFSPVGAATWLLCSLDRGDPDIADGLCDLGFGCPELGSVRITELESVVLPLGLRPERDLYFKPSKTLSQCAEDARGRGHIHA